MDVLTILDEYTTALAEYSDIERWCVDYYSQAHRVYQGIDIRKLPKVTEVPAINIVLMHKRGGDAQPNYLHTIGIVGIIHDTATTTTTRGDVSIIKATGVTRIEQLRKHAENCITDYDTDSANSALSGLRVDDMRVDFEMLDIFPFFRFFMELDFVRDRYLGEDPFA